MEVILSYECVLLQQFLKNVEVFKMILCTRSLKSYSSYIKELTELLSTMHITHTYKLGS